MLDKKEIAILIACLLVPIVFSMAAMGWFDAFFTASANLSIENYGRIGDWVDPLSPLVVGGIPIAAVIICLLATLLGYPDQKRTAAATIIGALGRSIVSSIKVIILIGIALAVPWFILEELLLVKSGYLVMILLGGAIIGFPSALVVSLISGAAEAREVHTSPN